MIRLATFAGENVRGLVVQLRQSRQFAQRYCPWARAARGHAGTRPRACQPAKWRSRLRPPHSRWKSDLRLAYPLGQQRKAGGPPSPTRRPRPQHECPCVDEGPHVPRGGTRGPPSGRTRQPAGHARRAGDCSRTTALPRAATSQRRRARGPWECASGLVQAWTQLNSTRQQASVRSRTPSIDEARHKAPANWRCFGLYVRQRPDAPWRHMQASSSLAGQRATRGGGHGGKH